ncbi:hypothetical protein [Nocardia iowensis]|uniref:Uncharacterized protein n=2 Tax=Nocardia iowensis TaxID=204891 RepID=A0ABX8RPE8_NOCIO|nr:hypothetical protein [Nocardia iowensis]QXN90285.1 hypothetical protein KV110_33475 [Nocardia iowensis]
MSEQRTGCRESIELSCARCGQVVSCDGHDHTSIITELIANNTFGFGDLVSALMLSSWELKIEPRVIDGNPHVFLTGTPIDQHGHRRFNKHEVIGIWRRRPTGWTNRKSATGYRPTGSGQFEAAPTSQLAQYVIDNPASWVRVAR